MKVVLQRVKEAQVEVNGVTFGAIGIGMLVLLGISKEDTQADAEYLRDKILGLRIFPDAQGRMNCSIQEANGSLLIVSQFTLYGDCRRGRRPSFDRAASPRQAELLYNYFVDLVRKGPVPVETGVFQAHMKVRLVNDGPVTILIDSSERNQR
jgi:D-tyrosyl-tRNA(Tyr) deacylase